MLCRKFGWENYCKCAGFEDKCYKCYHENVDNYLEEMQAARAAIEVVRKRRWERSKKGEQEHEAGKKKNWKVRRTVTCTPCGLLVCLATNATNAICHSFSTKIMRDGQW